MALPPKKKPSLTLKPTVGEAISLLYTEVYKNSNQIEDILSRLVELLEVNKKILHHLKSFHDFEKKMFGK